MGSPMHLIRNWFRRWRSTSRRRHEIQRASLLGASACLIESRSRVETLEVRCLLAAAFPEFVDPNPNDGNLFGHSVVPLATGNVVITSPYDDAGATDAGAVYLFNGATGELITSLKGSHENDRIGRRGVVALPSGNYVIQSPDWNNGNVTNVGAATFGNGVTGIEGVVDSTNSLVGSRANDGVGASISVLENGNYVVRSLGWDSPNAVDVGAVTWASGLAGVIGPVSTGNSLIGSTDFDSIGNFGIWPLTNGNYVVASPDWDRSGIANAGAVTFGDGLTGVVGEVSTVNSFVGRRRTMKLVQS